MIKISRLIAILLCLSANALGQGDLQTAVFSSAGPNAETSGFSFNQTFTPVSSYFQVFEGYFPETTIFQGKLTYTGPTAGQSYEMRIGKGGQIYSLISDFGESVPPNHRDKLTNPDTQIHYTPFVDDCWMMVAVDGSLNDPANDNKYFIHQAGVYLALPEQTQPFYSPLVAEHYANGSYSVVNWGQQAHTEDNLDVIFTADVMYYTRYTNIGDGIIQVDSMMYNFGPDVMTHLNVPWGGIRPSSTPYAYQSNADGSYTQVSPNFGTIVQVENTDGWVAWSKSSTGNGPTLAIVFDNEERFGNNVIKWGRAGSTNRDYFVFAYVVHADDDLSFGEAQQWRYYYVVGESLTDVLSTIDQYDLKGNSFEDNAIPAKSSVPDVNYIINKTGDTIAAHYTSGSDSNYSLKATPYVNSYPLCLIKGADGSSRITTDLYTYSDYPYDLKASSWELLGYVDSKTSVDRAYVTVPSGSAYTFPDGYTEPSITSKVTYTSTVRSNEFDHVVITTVCVEGQACCNLPWIDHDLSITSRTENYSSGAIDISCAASVSISMDIKGLGPMEEADYLNVYYKVDGNSWQAISKNTNSFDLKTVSVSGLRGDRLEIKINAKNSSRDEHYTITNILVAEE